MAAISVSFFDVASAAGTFKPDPIVTEVGKSAARARETLNWALSIKNAGFSEGASSLQEAWKRIMAFNTIAMVTILIVLGFGLMLKASWAEGQRRTLVVLIVAFAASFLSFFIAVSVVKGTDFVQNKLFNLSTKDPSGITISRHLKAEDLLTVSFNYQDFKGFKSTDPLLQESANNALNLIRITTVTNYAIAVVIIIRSVILWLLVIFSPLLFPFLAFTATRNIAVFWLREYSRWLIIGPLFALFITAVPYIWQRNNISPSFLPTGVTRKSGLPLQHDAVSEKPVNVYASGINIMLTPPGEENPTLQLDNKAGSGDNLSETDTYARYIVALLMVWIAIILPFIFTKAIIALASVVSNSVIGYQLKSYIKAVAGQAQKENPSSNGKAEALINRLRPDNFGQKIVAIPSKDQINNSSTKINSASRLTQAISSNLSVQALSSASGITSSSTIVNDLIKHQETTSSAPPIQKIAQIELENMEKPELKANFDAAIGKFKQPGDRMGGEYQKLESVKNAIYLKQVEGSKAARSLQDTITNNVSSLSSQNISNQVFKSNTKVLSESLSNPQNITNSIEERANQNIESARESLPMVQRIKEVSKITNMPIKEILKSPENSKVVVDFSKNLAKASQIQKLSLDPNKSIQLEAKISEFKDNFKDEQESKQWLSFASEVDQQKSVGNKEAAKLLNATENISTMTESPAMLDQKLTQGDISELTPEDEKKDQFVQTQELWEKQYINGNVPKNFKNREEWIQSDLGQMEDALKDLSDEKTREQGLNKLNNIIPYILLGGYELIDIVVYLKAKITAAKDALQQIFSTNGNKQTDQEAK